MRNLSLKTVFSVLVLLVLTTTSCVNKDDIARERQAKIEAAIKSSNAFKMDDRLIEQSFDHLNYLYSEMPFDVSREYQNALGALEANYVRYINISTANVSDEEFNKVQINFYDAVLAADKLGITIRLYDPNVGMIYNGYELKAGESITIRQ